MSKQKIVSSEALELLLIATASKPLPGREEVLDKLPTCYCEAGKQTMKDSREVFASDKAGLEALDYFEAHFDLLKGRIDRGEAMDEETPCQYIHLHDGNKVVCGTREACPLYTREKGEATCPGCLKLNADMEAIDDMDQRIRDGESIHMQFMNGTVCQTKELDPIYVGVWDRVTCSECRKSLPKDYIGPPEIRMKERGLFEKYKVERTDGKPLKGGCIVLEWGDPNARSGIREFMEMVKTAGYMELAIDLAKNLDYWEGKTIFDRIDCGSEFFFKEVRYLKIKPIEYKGAKVNAVTWGTGDHNWILFDAAVLPIKAGKLTYAEAAK